MKKTGFFRIFLIFAIFPVLIIGLNANLYAEESEINLDAGRQDGTDKLFVTISYGFSASWLTRIVTQTERSNFVFKDFFPGLYLGAELRNIQHITPMIRLTAYYPAVSTFNGMIQKPNTPVHFGADLFTGLRFDYEKAFFRLHAGPALHLFFLNSDRWNYFDMGAAAVAGVELALSPGWTLLIDGTASFDNGNLGANRKMDPFDVVWQYQIGLGGRYSKKMRNHSPLFAKRNNDFENIRSINR